MKITFKTVLLLISFIHAQSSVSDLTDSQIDQIKSDLQVSEAVSNIDNKNLPSPKAQKINLVDTSNKSTTSYFGYNFFEGDINFFDNTPTPPNYKLGPGDEIILSLWGETNSRNSFTINKEGFIYYDSIGFINLSNKTIDESEQILTKALTSIYSTLNNQDNPTNLRVELGKIKSINIYFTGQISVPGITLIHPFSDIFSAISQAGGVKTTGSLRYVQLIRDNEVIKTVDFYSFFINAKNEFSDIKIIDGDVLHIPVVKKRVQIIGATNKEAYFELLENETLDDLVKYAGGLKATSSSNAILDMLIPIEQRSSDDMIKASKAISIDNLKNIIPSNGDLLNIPNISDQEIKVSVRGRVKSPGNYPANLTLKGVLDLAGGFNDPVYRNSINDEILILRKDKNQLNSRRYDVLYEDSNTFNLIPGDEIFVYEDSEYNNLLLAKVTGEVKKRGTYQFRKGVTVGELIAMAGGFNEIANPNGIVIKEQFTFLNESGDIIEQTQNINDATLDYEITRGVVVDILPIENVVKVSGNVFNPGLIIFSGGNIRKYINLAGGYKQDTLKNKVYIQRANGKIRKISLLRGLGVQAKRGDVIYVPENMDPPDFNITEFFADLSSTLANIAAILIIADKQNN